MFSLFKKKPKDRVKKEFVKLLKLEKKRKSFIEKYGFNETNEVQLGILKNNLLVLGNILDNDSFFKVKTLEDFNIQGTKPSILYIDLEEVISYDLDNNNKIIIIEIQTYPILEILYEFSIIDSYKIKNIVKKRLRKIAYTKIINEVETFSKQFKGNEEHIKNFIVDKDVFIIKKRIEIVNSIKPYILDNDDFNIDYKERIYIDINENIPELRQFLLNLDNKKYDFILKKELHY